MKDDGSITLGVAEAKRLQLEYAVMADDVQCLALALAWSLELEKANPARSEELKKRREKVVERISSNLAEFYRVLRRALEPGTEPGAPPNGGPTTPLGNSVATEGPPSVS